jgi:hypothetical protein
MIDVKQAIQTARAKAAELLDQPASNLEEIERETYNGDDVWSITLSYPQEGVTYSIVAGPPLQYKRFLINAKAGELLAMKIREVATQ